MNTATSFVNDPDRKNGITSNPVTTNWGDMLVREGERAHPGATPCAGAKFEVYAAAKPLRSRLLRQLERCRDAGSLGGTVFTTGANGRVTIPGLFVSDSSIARERCTALLRVEGDRGTRRLRHTDRRHRVHTGGREEPVPELRPRLT